MTVIPLDLPDMPPADQLPAELLELRTDRERRFVWIYSFNGGNATQAAIAAGYSNVAQGARVRAHGLTHRADVQRALRAMAQKYFYSLAPKAIFRLEGILDNPQHPKHMRAIEVVADRLVPTKTQVDVNVSGEVVVNHTDEAIQQLRMLKGMRVPREELEKMFGFSGLSRYEKMLLEADRKAGKVIEHES